VISICAGDGRDIIGVLKDHPRKNDVSARLVELNPELVQSGRQAAQVAGLTHQIEFFNGDATKSASYTGVAPADLVIVCGVFGNVRKKYLFHLVGSLRFLCRAGGYVVWTRLLELNGTHKVKLIRELLHSAGFEEVSLVLSRVANHAVGSHRYLGEVLLLPDGKELFRFINRRKIEAPHLLFEKIRRLWSRLVQ
jgi:hypothetical protein